MSLETPIQTSFKRALVIVPPLRDFYFTRHRFSSLGAHIVTCILRREGLQTELLNFPLLKPHGTRIEVPDSLNYLKPYVIPEETGKLSFFTTFRRFGPDVDQCAAIIETMKPDICFMSVFAFCYADDAIELAEKIKKRMPRVPLIAGGAGVSAYPGYFLNTQTIDFTLCGEAEAGLTEFLHEAAKQKPDFNKVPNCAWKENGTLRVSPLHAYAEENDIEIALVKSAENARRATFSTSLMRGCPKQCEFCSSAITFGRKLRRPPLERLDKLLSVLSKKVGRDNKRPVINLEDDNLLCDGQFLQRSLQLFSKYFPGAEFIAENGIDFAELNPEWCNWLISNGMCKFNLSLASVDSEMLARQGRFLDIERYEKTISFLAEKGIPSVTYFICGLKEDTLETTANNLTYLLNKQTVIGISMFYAVPGLPGFTNLSRFERSTSILCLGSAAYPWNDSLSTGSMITAFRLSRYINLKKSGHRSETENRLLSSIESQKKLFSIIRGKAGNEIIIDVPEQDKELVGVFFNKLQKKTPRG